MVREETVMVVHTLTVATSKDGRFLFAMNPPRSGWEGSAGVDAAKRGHLDALRWLTENGFPINEETTSYVAKHDHLGSVQLLSAHQHRGLEKSKI